MPLAVDSLAQHSLLRSGSAAAAFFQIPASRFPSPAMLLPQLNRRTAFAGRRRQSHPPAASAKPPAQAPVAFSPASAAEIPSNHQLHQSDLVEEHSHGGLALGCVGGAVRLVRLQLQLSRLRKTCHPTATFSDWQDKFRTAQCSAEGEVQISDAVTSPFVCGLLKRPIILPRMLAQHLSPGEVSALLSHEMAHLRRHDLACAWPGAG